MFPRDKVDYLYRILSLLAFLIVILFINSSTTVIIIALAFFILTIMEKRVENIFLYIVTIIVFLICFSMKNYLLLRIICCVDYIHYFLNNETIDYDYDDYDDDIVIKRDERYIRFEKKKERVVNNNGLCTLFVLVHMVLLLLAIVVC